MGEREERNQPEQEESPEQQEAGGYLEDPNRNAVGLEPAWAEGYGGGDTSGGGGPVTTDGETFRLDEMTKDELLAYAQDLGVKPANAAMTKDELRAGVDAKLAEPRQREDEG